MSELTVEWFENFQLSSYQPMQGLLSTEDFHFLSHQPGFDKSLFRKLRRDRLRIFRQYLNRLILDFNRLHALARLVISQSSDDQSALFGQLMSLRFRFWWAVVRVELSYLVCRFGMRPVVVDEVIQHLETMTAHMASLPQFQIHLSNLA